MKEFDECFFLLQEYSRALQGIDGTRKSELSSEKRTHTRQQSSMAQKFVHGGCPGLYADFLAAVMQGRAAGDRFRDFTFNCTGSSTSYQAEYTRSHSFGSPCCFLTDDSASYYHRLLKSLHIELTKSADEKYNRAVKYIADNPKAVAIAASVHTLCFKINEEGGEDMFQIAGHCQPCHVTQKSWHVKLALECSPSLGLGCFATVTHGFLLVMILSVSQIVDYGYGIDTALDFLENQDKSFFEGQAAFAVSVGNSVWCPFGFIPICIGIGPSDNTKAMKEKYGLAPSTRSLLIKNRPFAISHTSVLGISLLFKLFA